MSNRFNKNEIIYEISILNNPSLNVVSIFRSIFEIFYFFGNRNSSIKIIFDTIDWSRINPSTGPTCISEAYIGGILEIADTVKRYFPITKTIKEGLFIMQYLAMVLLELLYNMASTFCAVLGHLKICQIVDPLKAIRFCLPAKIVRWNIVK